MRFVPPLAVLAWAGLIFFVSSLPNPPGSSGREWQSDLAHITEYAVLGTLLFWALRASFPTSPVMSLVAVSWLACVAYGISDEYHQSFVPNRDSSPLDVGFDSLGSALAMIALVAVSAARGPGHRDRSR